MIHQPNEEEVRRIITTALAEDIGEGDVTSHLIIVEEVKAKLAFVAREPLLCCGLESVVARVFAEQGVEEGFTALQADGARVEAGDVLAVVEGCARHLLAAERVALNLLQRMCGVATLTAKYVEAVTGTQAVILDTRKTMPGLRELDKYAVRVGGGHNHRMRLDDMVLVKDNHIALAGGIREALTLATQNAPRGMKIVVECENLEQVKIALDFGVDRILLDNMDTGMLRAAAAFALGRTKLEASGGVSLENVRDIAMAGVDYISVGKITHSAEAVDIGLDVTFD